MNLAKLLDRSLARNLGRNLANKLETKLGQFVEGVKNTRRGLNCVLVFFETSYKFDNLSEYASDK
jgi:hypothetical protein